MSHTCHTHVVFVSDACCFHGMGDSLATHAYVYMRVHRQVVLHTHVPTRTQNVCMQVVFASFT